MWKSIQPGTRKIALLQAGLLALIVALWHVLTAPGLIPPFVFENDRQAAFFVGDLPSATSWVFSSLHTSVGLAFVGAVVGEYLGSSRGVGYLILQAEGTFDINTVMAGILVLTAFALLLDAAVGRIEKRLMKWQPRQGETEQL